MQVPRVRGPCDVAMIAGPLALADHGRFKEMEWIYEEMQIPRWDATRLAYEELALSPRE